MKVILNNKSRSAYFNTAMEEHIIKHLTKKLDDDILLFWQNENAILVGRNQNTLQQINRQKCEELGIQVVRRLSGGGTVYHDMGNILFSFISSADKQNMNNYKKFTQPIIDALEKEFGIKSEFSGKNDITIDGKKISGNAQYLSGNTLASHGTLLFNINMMILPELLYVDKAKLVSKGIDSVRARVTNILPLLEDKTITVQAFISKIMNHFLLSGAEIYELTDEDVQAAEELAESKYKKWEWNFGKSPEANLSNQLRFEAAGLLNVEATTLKGRIEDIRFYGDYLSVLGVELIEKALIGAEYEPKTVRNILSQFDLEPHFGKLTLEDIIKVIFME